MNTKNRSIHGINTTLALVRAKIEREFDLVFERDPRIFQLALNEAEALAWETEFPQLVFPALALEKIQGVAKWQGRQRSVHRNEAILALAA
jgi:hypothetical protein